MTARIILNPYSGRYTGRRRWPEAQAALDAAGFAYELASTERPGHARELARDAALAGLFADHRGRRRWHGQRGGQRAGGCGWAGLRAAWPDRDSAGRHRQRYRGYARHPARSGGGRPGAGPRPHAPDGSWRSEWPAVREQLGDRPGAVCDADPAAHPAHPGAAALPAGGVARDRRAPALEHAAGMGWRHLRWAGHAGGNRQRAALGRAVLHGPARRLWPMAG